MKAIIVENPGKHSSLTFRDISTPEPGAYEILVKIEATALNRADLLQRKGHYPPPENTSSILGLEMAGIVEKLGAKVSDWNLGDFVFGLLPGGGYAEFCVIHEKMAIPIPSNMSFTEAAAVPETFLTAYQALNWLGTIEANETVLIHAGGSGVGTAAIQLARKVFSARVVTTAGKKRKLKKCKELGAEFVYHYKKQDFAKKIINDLGNHAIDLIIDFIGAPYWKKNMEVLAQDGRIIFLSMLGGDKIKSGSLMPILRKRLSIKGSTLRSRPLSYKIKLTSEFARRTLDAFEQETIFPVIDKIYDWSDTEKAHRRMSKNKNTGKIILKGM